MEWKYNEHTSFRDIEHTSSNIKQFQMFVNSQEHKSLLHMPAGNSVGIQLIRLFIAGTNSV